MSSQTERNDPCGCGSGKKYKDCCGAPKLEVASVRVKDVKDVELTVVGLYLFHRYSQAAHPMGN